MLKLKTEAGVVIVVVAGKAVVQQDGSGVATIFLQRGGGHGRMAHGFRSSWWWSHPEVKAIWC